MNLSQTSIDNDLDSWKGTKGGLPEPVGAPEIPAMQSVVLPVTLPILNFSGGISKDLPAKVKVMVGILSHGTDFHEMMNQPSIGRLRGEYNETHQTRTQERWCCYHLSNQGSCS
jgi:hypothetical protein